MKEKSMGISEQSMGKGIKSGYTRVTEILGTFQDLSILHGMKGQKAKENFDAKTKVGIEVHEYIHAYYSKEFCPVSAAAQEYVFAFKSAMATEFKEFIPARIKGRLFLEQRLYSEKLKITGQIDMLAEKDDKFYLVDFKTTYAMNLQIWSLQTALYATLLMENGVCDNPRVKVLHLKKAGAFSFLEIKMSDKLYRLATSAVELYRFLN